MTINTISIQLHQPTPDQQLSGSAALGKNSREVFVPSFFLPTTDPREQKTTRPTFPLPSPQAADVNLFATTALLGVSQAVKPPLLIPTEIRLATHLDQEGMSKEADAMGNESSLQTPKEREETKPRKQGKKASIVEYMAEYRKTHAEITRAYRKDYRAKNAEKINAYEADYRKKHAAELKAYQGEYWKKNAQKIKEKRHLSREKNKAAQILLALTKNDQDRKEARKEARKETRKETRKEARLKREEKILADPSALAKAKERKKAYNEKYQAKRQAELKAKEALARIEKEAQQALLNLGNAQPKKSDGASLA